MFRIVLAEMKKTFAKMGIFILAGILIAVLFASSLIYKPQTKDKVYLTMEAQVNSRDPDSVTVEQMFNNCFMRTDGNGDYQKANFDALVEKQVEFVNKYYTLHYENSDYVNGLENKPDVSKYSTKSDLQKKYALINDEYNALGTNSSSGNTVNATKNVENLISYLNDYNTLILKASYGSSGSNGGHYLINEALTLLYYEDDYKEISSLITNYIDILNNTKLQAHQKFDSLKKENCVQDLLKFYNSTIEFKPSEEILQKSLENIKMAKEYQSAYFEAINSFVAEKGSSKEIADKRQLNLLATKYKYVSINLQNLIDLSIKVDALKGYSANTLSQLTPLSKWNFNLYQVKEDLVKLDYMFSTNTFDFEYATPLSMVKASNESISAYDFAYFALRLCAFIVIIYCIVLSAGSIAGEQQAGTFKLMAIRPYSRTRLFFGKMLATLTMGLLLLTISAIATLVAGLITYSASSLPVLIVFNASTPIVMPVIAEFLIMLLTMYFELIFFVIMSYGISTIFKSNVGAVAVSIFIYFASLILNSLSASVAILRFIPFTNINLFKFFGSSFLGGGAENILFAVFTPTVVLGSNFVFSLLMSSIFAIVVLTATVVVFNKRDLK